MANNNLNIILFSEFIDKIHYGLTLATASRALDENVILFFAMKSIRALTKNDKIMGWNNLITETGESAKKFDLSLREKNLVNFEELISLCNNLEIKFMLCEMGMKYLNLNINNLRQDIDYLEGGLITILDQPADTNTRLLFI